MNRQRAGLSGDRLARRERIRVALAPDDEIGTILANTRDLRR